MADQANKFDLIVELLTTQTGRYYERIAGADRLARPLVCRPRTTLSLSPSGAARERLLTYLLGRPALPVGGFVLALLAIVANAFYFKADATILTACRAMLFWLGITRCWRRRWCATFSPKARSNRYRALHRRPVLAGLHCLLSSGSTG